MNFNKITTAEEQVAIAKFNQYGVGVVMGRFTHGSPRGDSAKWADLMDANLYSLSAIRDKMKEIGRNINNSVQDELIGDTSTAFTVTDAREQKINFSWLEVYTFLRAALRERMTAAEYKSQLAELKAAEAVINTNLSAKERRKAAEQKVAELRQKLGLEPAAPSVVSEVATSTVSDQVSQ